MRAAVIDLGSNSIRLLVADFLEDSVVTVHKDLITTRLGSGVAQNRRLDDTSMTATLSALIYFKDKAKAMGSKIILAFGTSALRDAKNSNVFLDGAKRIGLKVDILSGQEEAFLSFLGARGGLKLSGMSLVIDIGGGSTELILGRENIDKSVSLPMGAVSYTQRYFMSDPPGKDEVERARSTIRELILDFAGYFKQAQKNNHITAVGVGGTLTTISTMVQELEVYDTEWVHGYGLDKVDVDLVLSKLLFLPIDEKRKLCGLSPQRADIITAGVLIAQTIMEDFNIPQILISETDIMEGYLLQKLV
ncbi:MAG TPA: Ppx/GppA family phosphatase [Thermoanaerobacterales bacterium]|jgi:exopolyphosphatase/guanosine-5'-triphosphate,3'-diphosphate pyrophosphatase|nr:Ppx/GppA family phosphatase [Thermoanaerobacterales bacterium]